jgi:hypothetical protein
MAPRNNEVDHICIKLVIQPGDHYYFLNGRALTIPVSQIVEGYDQNERVR